MDDDPREFLGLTRRQAVIHVAIAFVIILTVAIVLALSAADTRQPLHNSQPEWYGELQAGDTIIKNGR